MPKPVSLICAERLSIDQQSNLLSAFSLIEVIQAFPTSESPSQQAPLRAGVTIQIVASWAREEGDTDEMEFEGQILGLAPSGAHFLESPIEKFKFVKQFHRIFTGPIIIQGFNELGMFNIHVRIRRVGQDWSVFQNYPFFVQEMDGVKVPTTDPANSIGKSPA